MQLGYFCCVSLICCPAFFCVFAVSGMGLSIRKVNVAPYLTILCSWLKFKRAGLATMGNVVFQMHGPWAAMSEM